MRKALFVCVLIVVSAVSGLAQTTFYYPQIADGFQGDGNFWRTTIYLVNNASTGGAVTGTVTLTKSDGTPFNLSFADQNGAAVGSGNTISFNIPAGQTRRYVSAGNQQGLAVGFATVNASGPLGGTAIFSYVRPTGQLHSEAGVPAASAVARQAIVVETSGGSDTGVAYANPGSATANITLTLLNSDGATVTSTARTLAANQHTALFVRNGLFPSAPALTGSMRIESNTPLAVVALRADPGFTLYTTLPPATLASLVQPVIEYFASKSWLSPFSSIARLLAGVQYSLG